MTTSPPEREGPVAQPAFALRPETEADAPFRLALFRASRGPGWDQTLIPPDLLTKIMEQQFHAQTQGYRAAFPDARLEIVMVEGVPAGRLATHRAPGVLHLIDIAVTPERRGQGVGGAILRDLMDEARAAGAPLTLEVARDNLDAQRLYHRLGFALAGASDTHLALRWDPA
ncbi:MAG: GNAT family N-acetyltransferase [Caulobacter sp.]|nr:GNAT family N-acetyltransferase [Caulobacter sp.]